MKTLKNFLIFGAVFLLSCKKNDQALPQSTPVQTKVYRFDDPTNSSLMFQDTEAMAVFTGSTRYFEVAKVLRITAIDETTIEIANFAPVDLNDVTILCYIKGIAQPIKLLDIKKIRAHAIQKINYPFVEGTLQFIDIDGRQVDLSSYQAKGITPSQISFDFTGETALIKKLKKLSKLKWRIQITDVDKGNIADNWKDDPEPKDARRFTGLMINLAYLFQEEATRLAFVNEPITDNAGVLLSPIQKEETYQRLLAIPKFECGVCVNVAGLGGGSKFGLINYHLRLYLFSNGASSTSMHEIGHMLGFSHASSMTYTQNGHGATVPIASLYDQMLKANELPILSSTYYLESDLH